MAVRMEIEGPLHKPHSGHTVFLKDFRAEFDGP